MKLNRSQKTYCRKTGISEERFAAVAARGKQWVEAQIIRCIEAQQEIQMRNPPTSQAWQDASAEIHRLAELLTGKPLKDACGR